MGKKTGWFNYGPVNPSSEGGDHSNTQFGVLGYWAAANAGIEVNRRKVWNVVLKHYVTMQHRDGGWSYKGGGGTGKGAGYSASSGKMTSAAVTSLYVVWENLYHSAAGAFNGRSCPRCGRIVGKDMIRMRKSLNAGLK